MSKYVIKGGRKLGGEIQVAGNKNAVLPMMAASLLTDKEVIIHNVPHIKDVSVMAEILRDLGAAVKQEDRTMIINSSSINKSKIKPELARRLRASVLFLGPLLGRTGKIEFTHPGGDIIGRRGIETHIESLSKLRVLCEQDDLLYKVKVGKKKGGEIFLNEPSVTGTENILMYSSLVEEKTVIENAAAEPHIVCLAQLLNKMGAEIKGAGTSRIEIFGANKLEGAEHTVGSDFIEAGTFAVASALTGGELHIKSINEQDLYMMKLVLERMGVKIKLKNNGMFVSTNKIKAAPRPIQAGPWPGFPTDLMSPFIVLATQADGQMLLHDPMYESRMFFVDKLVSMGARITICDPHRVIVYGQTQLYGRHLASPDIRAGMALVIAALIAEGESTIDHAEIIERGYEQLDKRLSYVGAEIKKISN